MNGTPKHLTIRNATILDEIRINLSFGITESIVVEDSTISGAGFVNVFYNRRMAVSAFAYADGVFTISKSGGPIPWAVPGAAILYTDNGNGVVFGVLGLVVDVTEDGTNTLIHTTGPATIPSFASGDNTHIAPHPCRDVSVTNCTGSPSIVDHSTYAQKHRPLWEHVLRTLTGNFGQSGMMTCWGTLVSLRVNVTRAYTGAVGTLTVNVTSSAGSLFIDPDDRSYYSWQPTINLRVAGERVITPSGVTGAQSGDVLVTPKAVWLTQGIMPTLSGDTSGDADGQQAIVEIELTTDQGLAL